MSLKFYLKDKLPLLVINLLSMTALFLFLWINGNEVDAILLILAVWSIILLSFMLVSFYRRKKYLDQLLSMTKQLEERYLIAEMIKQPQLSDDQIYLQILRMAEKSMLEQIGAVRRERKEYREYIEQWVHEIKTPITAMKLALENHRTQLTGELLPLLEKINRYTEQALYYARSENAEKDYLIKEIRPFEIAHQAIADNKYLLLQNDVQIQVEECECSIYSDEKWLRFILNQLIANAVKYRSAQPRLQIFSRQENGRVSFCISDNGIGIDANDLPRIFEKGFTGQNGRKVESSTGIGLYLCKRLCDKLGIEISADSDETGTLIRLIFTINDFIHQVQD